MQGEGQKSGQSSLEGGLRGVIADKGTRSLCMEGQEARAKERGPELGRGVGGPHVSPLPSYFSLPPLVRDSLLLGRGLGVPGVGRCGEGPAGGKADGPSGRRVKSGKSRKTEGSGCVEEG